MKTMRFLALALTLLTVNVAFAADEIHFTVTGQNSVTFNWRGTTTEKTIGYGITSGVYAQVTATTPNPVPVSSSGPFWEAKLTGLTANTRYYYQIGAGAEHSFRTPPVPGSSNFNVYAQGNIGSTSTYFNTGAVQDIIANDLPSFVVGLGDLTIGCIPLKVSNAASDGGYSYRIYKSYGTPADNSDFRTRSTLRFFENDVEMRPAHSLGIDIRNVGLGRFTHWGLPDGRGESILFSASDNTDPRTNGKSYSYCITNTRKSAIDQHFNDVMVWSKEAAYMPVWGDRDTVLSTEESFANYKGRFAVPNPQTSPGSPLAGGEDWYYLDYGNVRFITMPGPWTDAWINWNGKARLMMAGAQANSNIKFIVTFVHESAYSSGHYTGSSTLKGILDALGDTYSKYKLNVSAHSNNYERSLPQHGVIHVNAGTGGANLVQDGICLWKTCVKPAWSAFRAMHLGALKLHFTASGIEGSFICGPAGGGTNDVNCTKDSILDSFTIGSPSTTFAPTVCASAPTSPLVVNVKNKGAKGNGVTNDTAAIQAAVNQVGGTGGTVDVPNGTYMIDAVTSLKLKSDMTFRMADGAILKAIPTSSANYNIIRIDSIANVNVVGGTVQGERANHLGTTGEWGMGVGIYASNNVVIEGVTAKDNWGDGFYIGGNKSTNNSTLCSVVSDNNRRQGISIAWANGVIIKNSIFKSTHGTQPMYGITAEPNPGTIVNNLQIINNEIFNNEAGGIDLNSINGPISNVIIRGNNIHDNSTIGVWSYGIAVIKTVGGVVVDGNNIHGNVRTGIAITNNSIGNTITNNTITNNGNTTNNNDNGIILYNGSTDNTVTGNTVTGNLPRQISDYVGGNTISGNITK